MRFVYEDGSGLVSLGAAAAGASVSFADSAGAAAAVSVCPVDSASEDVQSVYT